MQRAELSIALALALAACGGSNPEAKTAASKGGAANDEMSIGDAALRQGGMFGTGDAPPLASALEAHRLDKKIKLDGVLGEWPARTPATTLVQGDAADVSFQGAVQYDDQYVYVAGEASDAKFVAGKDHASLVLAIPGPGGAPIAHEIAFFAGKPGEAQGRVLFAFGPKRGEVVAGAKIVEAPRDGGYSFEAAVPWSAFPEARTVRVGLRGVLSYYDSREKTATILATGTGDAEHVTALSALPTEPEQALVAALLAPRGLAARAPSLDVYADIDGDPLKERISVFGRFLTILGQGYRDGKEFFYRDLGTRSIMRIDARDVTGEGKDDLLVRSRFNAGGTTHDWFEVWQIAPNGEPVTLFAHEIELARGTNKIANSVHVHDKEIEVALEPGSNWDAASYREAASTEVDPILLPWGPVRAQTYRLEGGRFERKSEVAQKGQSALTSTSAARAPSTAPSPSNRTESIAPAATANAGQQLLDQYRRDHQVPADTLPKVELTANVAEDARPERIVLMGNDIVVFGPGFKGGAQYAVLSLAPFASPGSVKELAARDLDGDGAADLIVRGTRVLSPAHGTGAASAEVTSDALFIYSLRDGKIVRVFAAEIAREQAANRVQDAFGFVPAKSGKGIDIELRPGKVTGWTEKTYPWPNEPPGAVEPLLLPWGRVASARYAWNPSSLRFEGLK
ncbi:MAG TPA: hypothetical protein VNO21_14835 [Polyangiaceae bacterium]|nr:hypothetical protein [Polyangiaceae bacterium]